MRNSKKNPHCKIVHLIYSINYTIQDYKRKKKLLQIIYNSVYRNELAIMYLKLYYSGGQKSNVVATYRYLKYSEKRYNQYDYKWLSVPKFPAIL